MAATAWSMWRHPGATLRVCTLFNYQDGAYPQAGLLQAPNGYFYGTATYGGFGYGGVVFTIDTNGNFGDLHSISYNGDEGRYPQA